MDHDGIKEVRPLLSVCVGLCHKQTNYNTVYRIDLQTMPALVLNIEYYYYLNYFGRKPRSEVYEIKRTIYQTSRGNISMTYSERD